MRVRDPEVIRKIRVIRNYSQRDLAFLCKRSQNAISLLERGKLETITDEFAYEIARRLDVPWESLFEARPIVPMQRTANDAHANCRRSA